MVEPWLSCPVLVWATEEMSSGAAIASLQQAIPPELVTRIGYSYFS